MHVSRDDMYSCVSSLLKYKIHLHLRDFIEEHLHYATVKFKVQIYIYIPLLEPLKCHDANEQNETLVMQSDLYISILIGRRGNWTRILFEVLVKWVMLMWDGLHV
jgi:hypothetical protein